MTTPLPETSGHISDLCQRLQIGAQRRELNRVLGGFHHLMWRLDTTHGSYAIKQLSPDTDLTNPDTTAHYNATETVADSFAKKGIPALHALPWRDDYLHVVESSAYLVYPWSDAIALDRNDISERHALCIAEVLAKIHRAKITVPALKEAEFDFHPEEKIITLLDFARQDHRPNLRALTEYLPMFLAVAEAQRTAIPTLRRHQVVSHGDLDQKNVLWSDSGDPVLIDWESARELNPTYEIINEAIDWSGLTTHFRYPLFEQILAAYRRAGGEIDHEVLPAAFHCILGDWLNWLMYNVGRAVHLEVPEQSALGAAQIEPTLATMLHLNSRKQKLLSLARGDSVAAC